MQYKLTLTVFLCELKGRRDIISYYFNNIEPGFMLKLLICLNILQKSWRICCKIFIVCLTILGHYVLDIPNMKMLQTKIYQMIWQKDLLASVPEKRCFIFLTTLTKKKEDFTARGLTIFHNLWKNTSQKETFMYDKCCYLNSKLVSVIILGFEIHLKQFSTSFSTTYLTSSNRLEGPLKLADLFNSVIAAYLGPCQTPMVSFI